MMKEKDKNKKKNNVKLAAMMFCMNCRNGSRFDLQNVEVHKDFVYCKLWNELKYAKGVCPNWG
jgi:hypothetical protein